MIDIRLSLELTKNGVQRTVNVKAGESGARRLLITFTVNGKVLEIEDVYTPRVYMCHDGVTSYDPAEISTAGNAAEYIIPPLAEGETIFEVRLQNGDTNIVYSPRFRIYAEGSIGAEADAAPIAGNVQYMPVGAQLETAEDIADGDYIVMKKSSGTANSAKILWSLIKAKIKTWFASVAISGDYDDLDNKPELAAVATSGSYNDLDDKPVLPELAAVATSGAYNDLTGKPALKAVATSGAYSDLTGKPALKPVAISGSYNDLTDKPSGLTLEAAAANKLGGIKIGYPFKMIGDVLSIDEGPVASLQSSNPGDDMVLIYNQETMMWEPYALGTLYGLEYGNLSNAPTDLGDFNNEAGYQTAEDVASAIADAVEGLGNQGGEQIVESDELYFYYEDDGSGYGGSIIVWSEDLPANVKEIKDILFKYNDEFVSINEIGKITLDGLVTPTFVQPQLWYSEEADGYYICFITGIYGSDNALITAITNMEVSEIKIKYTETEATV